MSPQPNGNAACAKHIDSCALLEYLPLPCLFVARDRHVAFANAAARRLVNPLARPGDGAFGGLEGAYICHDELLNALDLPTLSELERCMCQLEEQQRCLDYSYVGAVSPVPKSFTFHVAATDLSTAKSSWILTSCQIEANFYFHLIAVPTSSEPHIQEVKDRPSSEEEDWRMLQKMAEPTFNSPDLMCSIMTASGASYKLNERGRHFLSLAERNAESYPWTPREPNSKFQTALTDPEFTRQLGPEQGVAITSISRHQALLNCRRGLANPETGERTVCNASTILLNRPNSDDLLGVVVCVEPEEFSLYLQRYDNLRDMTPSTTPTTEWNRARLIRAITLDGDVDFVSTAWLDYTGLQRAALQASSWLECVHPDDRHKYDQGLSTEHALAKSRKLEVRFRGRDGLYRWFSDRTEPLLNEDGQFVRWYAMSEDVHDLVIKREQANTDKFLLEKIIAELDVVFFTLDRTYTVSSAFGTMEFDNLMSDDVYNSQSMIGANMLDFINSISPGGVPDLQRCLIDVMNGESPKEIVEYAFGPRYIRTILVPHINEDYAPYAKDRVQGVVGTSIDITAAREHDEVKAQMKVMEDTNRLKSEFLANVSHELRTPIAGMTGLVELLFETALDSQQIDYLESVQSSAHTLLQIVNDILDFSKAEASAVMLENIPFSIVRFIDDLCKRNRVIAAKKGLQFLWSPPSPDVQLSGDTGRIRQMSVRPLHSDDGNVLIGLSLDNLITNAIKFTTQGFVKLSAACQVSVSTTLVEVIIEDSGIGIDEQDLGKLFHPFVQADQSTTRIYGGSGLGLSIAKKLAEMMDGSITLESRKGLGTKARVALRLAQASIITEAVKRRYSQLSQKEGERGNLATTTAILPELTFQQKSDLHILFVEDNEINRKIVMAHLSSLGFKRVHAARNGVEAIEYVTNVTLDKGSQSPESVDDDRVAEILSDPEAQPQTQSPPDIIIMDCQMPIMDGYEATEKLRSILQYDRPIIALTASAIEGDREKCIAAGMDDHIAKPVSRKQLAAIIDKWALVTKPSLELLRRSMRKDLILT